MGHKAPERCVCIAGHAGHVLAINAHAPSPGPVTDGWKRVLELVRDSHICGGLLRPTILRPRDSTRPCRRSSPCGMRCALMATIRSCRPTTTQAARSSLSARSPSNSGPGARRSARRQSARGEGAQASLACRRRPGGSRAPTGVRPLVCEGCHPQHSKEDVGRRAPHANLSARKQLNESQVDEWLYSSGTVRAPQGRDPHGEEALAQRSGSKISNLTDQRLGGHGG
mmetsp:Transcript_2371/g.6726  ORF Transcript_2371/g.6726 Transcript_2371/m.6726 type:complete len:226 (-) Transcript_2371:543-1220(-)